jgi:hypothetical protein
LVGRPADAATDEAAIDAMISGSGGKGRRVRCHSSSQWDRHGGKNRRQRVMAGCLPDYFPVVAAEGRTAAAV